MAVEGVIFDLDGTLLDTLADIAEAANRALSASGLPVHSRTAYGEMVGDGMVKLAERALPSEQRSDANVAELTQAIKTELGRGWHQHTQPYFGIPELLAALIRMEKHLAVLSNKPNDLTAAAVAHFFANTRFDPVIGVQVDVPPKPDLTGVQRILDQWQMSASAVAYVGDTKTDMVTAKRAGFFAVGVTWGFRPAAELLAHGADALIEKPAQLLALL